MYHTYGLSPSSPAFVIDNIPIGQHVEKYVFDTAALRRPHSATPQQLAQFLKDFVAAPSPLQLLVRSTFPSLEMSVSEANKRGKVLEVSGATFEEAVLRSDVHVLLLVYSPSCPACQQALPVFDRLAASLAWSHPNVLIAKIDRQSNDVPIVLRFNSYPAIFFFKAGQKTFPSELEGGEEPSNRGLLGSRGWRTPIAYEHARDGDSCNAPISEAQLLDFTNKHSDANLLGDGSAASSFAFASEARSVLHAEVPVLLDGTAANTQQSGVAM